MTLTLVLPVVLLLPLIFGYNYCNNDTHICDLSKTKHFMCLLETDLPPYGKNTTFHALVPDTKKLQVNALGILNTFRNLFASGQLITNRNKTFPTARRMRRLIWDAELAYMARSHAATVSLKHSECRSTVRFSRVGECVAMLPPIDRKLDVFDMMTAFFNEMFDEYKEVQDPETLLHGYDPVKDSPVGHFTIIINDRVSRVGCGIAVGSNCHAMNKVGFCHFLTCHFDGTNVDNQYVYRAGKPASSCADWKVTSSSWYAFLCSNNGEIFPYE
ncbi:antigen 5 like allergen Cul n 1-like [Drosophila elegans]|uniref:antigen 5 like allergen Cul n 1-like n=1 Tax=Drosophila elegans TaxID=30023 RepID=UPI0007E67322|nr:antigen 5 like allergen Cul n 1-like [Drosophila elegans]